jgi:hypothetical protein
VEVELEEGEEVGDMKRVVFSRRSGTGAADARLEEGGREGGREGRR